VKAVHKERLTDVGSGKGPKRVQWDVEKVSKMEIASRYQEALSRKLDEVSKDKAQICGQKVD
jgi:hypothetical protein